MSRRALLAKVHIARKELALEEADYRALLVRVAGGESAAGLDAGGLEAVVAEMKRLGWKPPAGKPVSPKRHVRHVYALWGELARKGALADGSRAALTAFVRRQTGVGSPEWLTATDASKVAEGLKAMLKRSEAKGP